MWLAWDNVEAKSNCIRFLTPSYLQQKQQVMQGRGGSILTMETVIKRINRASQLRQYAESQMQMMGGGFQETDNPGWPHIMHSTTIRECAQGDGIDEQLAINAVECIYIWIRDHCHSLISVNCPLQQQQQLTIWPSKPRHNYPDRQPS